MEPDYLKHLADGHDRDAVLHDLMTEYGNDVWNFAFFLTRRADAADDLAQDVFLAAYDGMYGFRGECSVKSWLLAITRNKALNYMKRAFIRKVTLVEYIASKASAPSAEAETFDRMETKRIWDAVMRLPLKFREVLLLDSHYEASIQEMAHMLGISEGTVKSRLHRARKKLTALLAGDDDGGERR